MTLPKDKIEKVYANFENKISVLTDEKEVLLLNYRKKLEELKLKKVRRQIFNK